MPKNVVILVGTLDGSNKKIVNGRQIIYFTMMCAREGCIGYDVVECKVSGIEADRFERMNVPGTVVTVLGKLTSKITADGNLRMGVSVAFLSEGDRFDIVDEPDSEYMERLAETYDFDEPDEYQRPPEWTESMYQDYEAASGTERAYLRGKWGNPPPRIRNNI